ncbi:MAG: radical SAM family heme chaperone HemW [Bacteroidales bacterium]
MAGIYIHVPFCNTFCIYCGFYSEVKKGMQDEYVKKIIQEISESTIIINPSTLYIGGGTPSVLTKRQLLDIKRAVDLKYPGAELQEFTIEINPDDVSRELCETMKAMHVSRVSMGVQSFHDKHLKWMRRRHSASEAKSSYKLLRENGFNNISMDLIFGYEGLSIEEWSEDIDTMLELRPEHISAYQMSIEEDSGLGKLYAKGRYKEPGDEFCARQYSLLQEKLKEAGYIQYEVSNFCLPGYKSKHNSSYWEREPYLGFGPAAHSFIGYKRFWNKASLKNYVRVDNFIDKENLSKIRGEEVLTNAAIYEEYIMLGLRKIEGLSLELLKSAKDSEGNNLILPETFENTLNSLVEKGEIIKTFDKKENVTKIRIPSRYMFISDGIISLLI